MQSFEWGFLQEKLGRKVWRISIEDPSTSSGQAPLNSSGQAGEVLLQALVVKKPLPFGKSFLYAPFGPCFKEGLTDEQKEKTLEVLVVEIKRIAKVENSVYCYLEPFKALGSLKFKEPSALKLPQKRIQPQQTLVIDLLPAEEQIFKSLKSKTTRYNIRLSRNKGVEFMTPALIGGKEIDIFYNLAQKSAQRDGFANYDKNYFKNLFSISSNELPIKLFFAKYQENYIAANIFVFFNKTAVHLFGGFDYEFRSLMAPYFMHWNQMLFAKNKMGCEIYDFWGVDEKKWPGVTHFKRSFGGKEIDYPQGLDIVFGKFWYKIFEIARKILRK